MTGAVGIFLALAGLGLGVFLGWRLSHRPLHRKLAEHERALERAKSEARTDPLTKLWNRTTFDEQLRLWSAICRRYGSSVSLILFDLDAFKEINDRNGHAAGDAALVHLAGILRDSSRESDLSARVGGDEFAMLLPHTGIHGARTLAERIRRRVETFPCAWPPGVLRAAAESSGWSPASTIVLRVSAGVAEFHVEQTPARFVDQADQALYLAKQSGGNRVVANDAETLADHRPSDRSIR